MSQVWVLYHMYLRWILVAMNFLYLTWICIVLVDSYVVSHLGHVSKCVVDSWWCLKSSNLWTFALTLYLFLSKYIAYRFPIVIILWGASLLYQNIITLMLWDRYPLVCSNPSKFSVEKWRNKLMPCNFPSFELVTLFPHWQKLLPKKQRASTSLDTWAKRGATALALTTRSGIPLSPHVFFIGRVVLEFWRQKEKLQEDSQSLPMWSLIPMV